MLLRSAIATLCLSASAIVLSGCGSTTTKTVTETNTNTLALVAPATLAAQGQTVQYSATSSSSATAGPLTLSWAVNAIQGGNSTVGTISSTGLYTAPTSGASETVTITVSDAANSAISASASLEVLGGVTLAITANPQTFAYSVDLPSAGSVTVAFGPTTAYGRSTAAVTSTESGPVTVLVAGIPSNTTGHLQASVKLADGGSYTDADRTFTVGQSLPGTFQPLVSVTTYPNQTPQPGVEFVTDIYQGAVVYDLAGNVLWGYQLTPNTGTSDLFQGFKPLPNGHFLVNVSNGGEWPLVGPVPTATTVSEIREIDLAGTVIRSVNLADIQTSLNNSGYKDNQGNVPQLAALHHEITYNPTNGHWLMLASYGQTLTVGSYTGLVLGDVLLDVDPNNNFALDFFWNEFDHFDVTRDPYEFPDWTHSNAIVYSKDDGNVLVSIRHQSWIVKVNYQDAKGDGSVLWRFGYQGDFTLTNEAGPQDWQYNQHEPAFTTTNTTGKFGLTMMDNGDARIFTDGDCAVQPLPATCLYSRNPVFQVDEDAKTATVGDTSSFIYSYFGGSSEVLPNGNLHAAYTGTNVGSYVVEETASDTPTEVWSMIAEEGGFYRAHREPSLYPGVQWAQ